MDATARRRWTIEEYIAFEATSEVRHEFWQGEIFAMSGGSISHAFIKENLALTVGNQLKGTPCRTASSDLRIRIEASGFHTYPDVLVICGAPQVAADDPHSVLNPSIIFEVLSPSTERHDRGFKLDQYRKIPTLEQYILVAQHEPRVEVFAPLADGWKLDIYPQLESVVHLPSVAVSINLADIYAGIDFTHQG